MLDDLLNILASLQSGENLAGQAAHLLACVVHGVNADSGYIVVREGRDYTKKHELQRTDQRQDAARAKISRTLVREALRRGQVTLCTHLDGAQRLALAESIREIADRSVIAAPIMAEQQAVAVIYLERGNRRHPFSEAELELVSRFVTAAGLTLHQSLRLQELERLQAEAADTLRARDSFAHIIGHSAATLRLLNTVAQVAATDATVLITGETGCGKELVAKALYADSPRAKQPFVTLHCGALPETLFEAELFGHRRGAFTGADRHREGHIAKAAGGTLFIDEVAEIPLVAQAKLLRFFQFGEFQRVGSDTVERIDVRIIAATHRNLADMVAAGRFREDLYYRLNVIELTIPPLRDRRDDILPLFQHFLARYWRGPNKPIVRPYLIHQLETYDYPGNVRELEHAVQRLCVLAVGDELDPANLPPAMRPSPEAPTGAGTRRRIHFETYDSEALKQQRKIAGENAVAEVEQCFLIGLMEAAEHNVTEAARLAGLNRTYLYRLLAKHREAVGYRD